MCTPIKDPSGRVIRMQWCAERQIAESEIGAFEHSKESGGYDYNPRGDTEILEEFQIEANGFSCPEAWDAYLIHAIQRGKDIASYNGPTPEEQESGNYNHSLDYDD